MSTLNDPNLFDHIARNHARHSRRDEWWSKEDNALSNSRALLRKEMETTGGFVMGPVGFVPFSYVEMGAITTTELLGLDELILFSFYWKNRKHYHHVVDMGANIGLHSVLLGRMGLTVTCYEPDPTHAEFILRHSETNALLNSIELRQAAVNVQEGTAEFVRVLGNTTGSHIHGAKSDAYGKLEVFEVVAFAFADAITGADLVKMDVEGLEANLLSTIDYEALRSTDIVCEVGTTRNAEQIWNHFQGTAVNLFPQKINWARAESASDLPFSYREGSLFLSTKSMMPWRDN